MSTATETRMITAGVDVGTSAVKTVLLAWELDADGPRDPKPLTLRVDRIRRRDPLEVIRLGWSLALEDAGVGEAEIAYTASTGEGELVEFRKGHFYGMTTHARGASFLRPDARGALDVGGLHARAMRIGDQSRVLANRMTSQCASGSGQFLENVARYLGVALEEVGSLSLRAETPEVVSSVCAVLAETDVINMVSRGISTEDILKGIHLSMAGRYVKLLRALKIEGPVVVTGGLAADQGLVEAMREKIQEEDLPMTVHTHAWSVHAGALGAALWGGHRHHLLERRQREEAKPA